MNDAIFFFFYNLAHKSAFLDGLIIFTAVYFPYLVIIFAFIFLFKNKKDTIVTFITVIMAWFLDFVLKILIRNPRPFNLLPQVHPLFSEHDFSFPSGHATFFMALALSIFLINKKAGLPAITGYVFIFFAFLIGIARIVAGVHFPSDILSGFILGSLIAYFINKYVKI